MPSSWHARRTSPFTLSWTLRGTAPQAKVLIILRSAQNMFNVDLEYSLTLQIQYKVKEQEVRLAYLLRKKEISPNSPLKISISDFCSFNEKVRSSDPNIM